MKSILFVIVMSLFSGCIIPRNMSHKPKYRDLIGKEYRTKRPLYVFRYGLGFRGPLHLGHPAAISKLDIETVTFPVQYNNKTIYGIIEAGLTFKVTKIYREKNFFVLSFDYRGVLTNSTLKGKEVKVIRLTDYGSLEHIPRFKPYYVEEVGVEEGAEKR